MTNNNQEIIEPYEPVTIYNIEEQIKVSVLDTPCLLITNSDGDAFGKYVFKYDTSTEDVYKTINFFIINLNKKSSKFSTIIATIKGRFSEFINIDKITVNNILDFLTKKSTSQL
jgi:hypothetical protein